MPVALPLAPDTRREGGYPGSYPGAARYPGRAFSATLTPLRYSGGLVPLFTPGSFAIPGAYIAGGISTLDLAPVAPLQGVCPGPAVYPAKYPGRGSVITLTQRSVAVATLTPVQTLAGIYPGVAVYPGPARFPGHGSALPLAQAAAVVKTLTALPTIAGIFPGPSVYPGPARYPGHGTTVRLVPEPVAA